MITINVNGLTLCHKGSGGVTHNTLPDVCKTPPLAIPVPFENEAYSADLIKGTSSVFADGGNMIANFGSCFAKSVFDEAGSMGGVKSGTFKAEADWISHSFDVFFEGKPACRLTDKMFMNHRNTVNMAGLIQPPLPELDVASDMNDTGSAAGDENANKNAAGNTSAQKGGKDKKPADKAPQTKEDKTDDEETPLLPCIVILIHGVNDVGEAYENQDKGICTGLNNRLGRGDLHPHDWIPEKFMISDTDGNATSKSDAAMKQTCKGTINRSPIIPFYWGYRPVDHDTWKADQVRYRQDMEDLKKKGQESNADIPYDTYLEDDEKRKVEHNNANIDNLDNWVDSANVKNGGTFANATTCIPDMFGPGAAGKILEKIAELSSRGGPFSDKEDWSHPIYQNPHRIYQAYAARRLADLIIDIRQNPDTENDTINIVAHSQGTIITMLANMWVNAKGLAPADCVIFNHSPYALENRWLENFLPGNQQTTNGRLHTLTHFCALMAKNPLYSARNIPHTPDYRQKLKESGCLSEGADKSLWNNPQYSRNNFGMVYNYFCPNDQIVSMPPIQGFGWRGIPDEYKAQIGNNLWQRVFCRGVTVGDRTGFHFEMPAHRNDDSKKTGFNYRDITINAPLLPEPFIFKLMGEGENYKAPLSGNDPAIAKAAMKAEKFISQTIDAPKTRNFNYLTNNQNLNEVQCKEISNLKNWEVINGVAVGQRGKPQMLVVKRRMTDKELETAVQIKIPFSQHSSIVASKKAPSNSMTYDLAIGECKAFEHPEFWKGLLLQADWRRQETPKAKGKKYYETGMLPPEIKPFMNKPEQSHGMPLGEFGVENDYGAREGVVIVDKRAIENPTKPILQWDMPATLDDKEII